MVPRITTINHRCPIANVIANGRETLTATICHATVGAGDPRQRAPAHRCLACQRDCHWAEGRGRMTHRASPDNPPPCPMCGGTVTGVHRSGSWRERNGGGGFWFDGKCVPCDIDFRLSLRNREPGTWRMIAPEKSALLQELTTAEVDQLNNKLLRYKALGEKWRTFQAKRRPTDELWRFDLGDERTGIAIVREGTPIAEFRFRRF